MATEARAQEYTLVVGLGVTGLSVARFLLSRGEYIVVADSRDIPPARGEFKKHYPDIALHTGAFDAALFTGANRIVLSPGVPLDDPAVIAAREQGVEIIGDIELFAREVKVPVVAITGSNGKSTVTTLLTEMLNAGGVHSVMGGNIGTPVLELLNMQTDVIVLELSSFQLDTLQRCNMLASVVLNVAEDHMDRYASFEAYTRSKLSIYQHAQYKVINLDDANAEPCDCDDADTICYGMAEPADGAYGVREIEGERWLCYGDKQLVAVERMHLKGEHNVSNALAAMALCDAVSHRFNIDRPNACMALAEFSGLKHRTQWVADIKGVSYYNDSKATNVGAAIAAITGMSGRNILIAGGVGKGADFSALREVAAKHLKAVVLIGESADELAKVFDGAVEIVRADSMQSAVEQAQSLASAGDAVLLSPACASFDMFDNYEHRGDEFVRCVQELGS